MTKIMRIFSLLLMSFLFNAGIKAAEKPWDHGPLRVAANQRFLCHSDSTPFFWLGDT